MASLRKELEHDLTEWSSSQKNQSVTSRDAMELWLKYDRLTSSLAMQLCEQLRLVIEPTLASKMMLVYLFTWRDRMMLMILRLTITVTKP